MFAPEKRLARQGDSAEERYLRPVPHLSDSTVQCDAEAVIIERLADALGVPLQPSGRVAVGGAYIEVDARSEDDTVFVEAYARQGALKGAQLKKIGQDILKFVFLRRQPEYADAHVVIAFASPEARDSVRGWLACAADEFGIELRVVEVPCDLRQQITEAQQRQVMVNLSTDEASVVQEE